MKLASYIVHGRPTYGVLTDGGVHTIEGRFPTLKEFIAADMVWDLKRRVKNLTPDLPLTGLVFLPPITNPNKILCVGLNYRADAAEHGHAIAEKPNIFTKF